MPKVLDVTRPVVIEQLIITVCLCSVLVSCTSLPTTQMEPPNVIFIMADDLGYADIGPYGQTKIKTPHLDKMAREGMMFTQFYAGTAVCAPSRAVLMTGLHIGHVEIRGNKQFGNREGQQPMTPDVMTIATLAKSAGYHTGMIGKWRLGDPHTKGNPSNHGFDYFYGYTDQVLAHNYYPEYLWRNGEKIFLKNEVQYLDSTAWHAGLGSRSIERVEYSHDLFIDEAVAYISRHQTEPFLLYLPLTIPHDNGEQVDSMVFEVPSQGIYTNKDWTKKEKDYAAMVTCMDEGIGKIVGHLQQQGLLKNTVICFTSDNGPMRAHPTTTFFNSNGPLRGGKRDLYEGGIRVPMIVQWSGQIQEGSTSAHIAAFWDVLPTLADLFGIELSDPTDGISFLPTLLGEGVQTQHSHLYWEFHEGTGAQALRQEHWKIVKNNVKYNSDSPLELYDLSKDIAEENNLAADRPEKKAALEQLLKNSRTVSSLFPLLNADN